MSADMSMVLSLGLDGWGESLHRKPLDRAANFLPSRFRRHAVSPAGVCFPSLSSAKGCALALRGEARGLFLRSASVRHGPKSLFFAHR